jgi:hypothetical protein
LFRVKEPFSSTRQLAGFLTLLVAVLLWPMLNGWLHRAQPWDLYRAVPPSQANHRFIADMIEQGGTVDVLVIGSSDSWTAFDCKILETEIGRLLQRPVRVLNFSTNWYGAEITYAKVINALPRLRPKVVLLPDLSIDSSYPHALAKFVWSSGVPLPPALSMTERGTLFAATLLGAPHYTWMSLKDTRTIGLTKPWNGLASDLAKDQGYYKRNVGWLSGPKAKRRAYVDLNPPVQPLPVDQFFYQGREDKNFKHSAKIYTRYQSAFMKAIDEAVRKSGGEFVTVSLPVHFAGPTPDDLAMVVPLDAGEKKSWQHIGVSMPRMVPGMPKEKMLDFYYDQYHLNASGARLFSRTIAPAIAQLVRDAETK